MSGLVVIGCVNMVDIPCILKFIQKDVSLVFFGGVQRLFWWNMVDD